MCIDTHNMEIPSSITEKGGKQGEAIYKTGHKDGKLEGAKQSKDKFAIEVNSMANQVVNGKGKEGYKAPSIVDVGKKTQQIFAIGKDPTRNDLKQLAIVVLKSMEALPLPEKKKPETKPAS